MSESSAPSGRSFVTRLRAFGLSALVVAGCLVAIEVALRLLGIGGPDRFSSLASQRVELPLLHPTELDDGTPVVCTVDPRLPVQCVPRERAPGTLRVLVFGGSATAGLGYSPNVTFARHLERMLGFACPGREVEVLNLGIAALSSKQVRLLVEHACATLEPDALIVYSGNHEFLELQAERHVESERSFGEGLVASLKRCHVYRALRGAAPQTDLDEPPQTQVLEQVRLTDRDVERVLDAHEANLRGMARAAADHGVPLFLMNVASNWMWRGREDLPEGWIEKLVTDGSLLTVRSLLDTMVESAPRVQRHDWLFRRAELNVRLGEYDRARSDYRESSNADPHLRRAPDAMAQRVALVAEDTDAVSVDTIALLSQHARHGIPGFEEFYDSVHFTPRGATLVAGELYRTLEHEGIFVPREGFNAEVYLRERLSGSLTADRLPVHEWMGSNSQPGYHRDRDPRKFERALEQLEQRIRDHPRDAQALVFRGNAHFFRVGGRAAAESDYAAALEINPKLRAAELNLEACARDLPRVGGSERSSRR